MVTKAKIVHSSETTTKHKKNKIKNSKSTSCSTNCCIPQDMKRNLIILLSLIILATIALVLTHTSTPQAQEQDMSVVATINGEALYQYEVDNYWNMLSAQQKLQVEKDDLIEELIHQKLLLQRAAELDLSTSIEEAQIILETQIAQQGATYEDYIQWLESQNMNIDDVLKTLAQQTTLSKLLERETNTSGLDVNQEEINTYYENNKEQFARPQQMTVRHILVMNSENSNENELLTLVETIESELDAQNNDNFCDLVNEYTADLASKENCGEYTFERGVMVPEFENAAWDMSIGERRTVKSNYGYHIMLKMGEVKEGYYTLSDEVPGTQSVTFETAIGNLILEEKARNIFNEYVQELKKDAQIEF